MRILDALAADPVSRSAALALLHFLWQGALVALLFAAANVALRHSSARARHAAACAALAVMVALPAATFWRLRIEASAHPAFASSRLAAAPSAASPASSAAAAPPAQAGRDPLAAAAPWIVLSWLAGVCALSLRFLNGCLGARRVARGTRPADPLWQGRLEELGRRLGVRRAVRLLESAAVRVPSVVGLARPIVLIPAGIATGMAASQLESLLAHELAHIRRGDAWINVLQALAETLLFYHPAVWWASSRIRIERENACDDLAVAATGDAVTFARALLDLAERRTDAPALAVAADGGALWSRISRLVGPPAGVEAGAAPRWLAGALAMGAVLALGAAAAVPPPAATSGPTTPAASSASAAAREEAPEAPASPAPTPAPRAPKPKPEPASPKEESAPARGLLSPDDLIAFRIHGVTPEFIGEIVALGYTRSTPDELVALRIHGVTPEYIKEMTAIFGKLPLDQFVAFRIHGLTPETLRELEKSFGKVSADDAVAMRIHGVDAEFVAGLREAGFTSISADDAVALRIHGATPEFARAMRAQGFAELSPDDLVAFRIHGVTPEYVSAIRALGYKDLTPDDVTAFRIHGLTVESIRAMNERAGELLSPDELVDRHIHARSRSAHKENRS